MLTQSMQHGVAFVLTTMCGKIWYAFWDYNGLIHVCLGLVDQVGPLLLLDHRGHQKLPALEPLRADRIALCCDAQIFKTMFVRIG